MENSVFFLISHPCWLISPQYSLFITPEKIFWAFHRKGNNREHWERSVSKTIAKFRLFPLWIYKQVLLKHKRTPISKWNAGGCIYDISDIATLVKYRWNEVELRLILWGQLQLNCIFKETKATFRWLTIWWRQTSSFFSFSLLIWLKT